MAQTTFTGLLGLLLDRARTASALIWKLEARLKGARFEGKAVFRGRPIISLARNSSMVIGQNVVLSSSLRANPLACFQPVVLRTLSTGAALILGPNVGISGSVLCSGKRIEIGEGTIIGSGAMILDNDFHAPEGTWGWRDEHSANAQPIIVGRGVFVGARAIILKGVNIGDRAIIGAGAVVVKDVPAGHTAVGNPARNLPPR